MKIIMNEERMKSMAKRLRKVLRGLDVDLRHSACLDLASELCGFEDWFHFRRRDPETPLSELDDDVSDEEFDARDAFQMAVLEAAGLPAVARELLDPGEPYGLVGQALDRGAGIGGVPRQRPDPRGLLIAGPSNR